MSHNQVQVRREQAGAIELQFAIWTLLHDALLLWHWVHVRHVNLIDYQTIYPHNKLVERVVYPSWADAER